MYADQNGVVLKRMSSLEAVLRAYMDRVNPGDYFAIIAYVERTDLKREASPNIFSCGGRRLTEGSKLDFSPMVAGGMNEAISFDRSPAAGGILR